MGRSEYRERIKQGGSKKTATTPPPTSADGSKFAKLAKITNELRDVLDEHIEDYEAFKDEILDVCSDHEARLRRIESRYKLATEEVDDSEAEMPKKSTSRKADKAEPEAEVKDYSGDGKVYNGPGYAYRYWSAKYRMYGIKTDLWAAKQAGNGVYEPIWVWYENGEIDHILTEGEIKKYAP